MLLCIYTYTFYVCVYICIYIHIHKDIYTSMGWDLIGISFLLSLLHYLCRSHLAVFKAQGHSQSQEGVGRREVQCWDQTLGFTRVRYFFFYQLSHIPGPHILILLCNYVCKNKKRIIAFLSKLCIFYYYSSLLLSQSPSVMLKKTNHLNLRDKCLIFYY